VPSINTSFNLADKLVIVQIFVNNEHFVNAVIMRKVACGQNANAVASSAGNLT